MRVTTPLRIALMIAIGPFALLACGAEDMEVADEIIEATGNETEQAMLIDTEAQPDWVSLPGAVSLANDDDAQEVINTRPDKSAKDLLEEEPTRFDFGTIRDGVVTPPTPNSGFDPGIWVPAPIDVLIDDEDAHEKEDTLPDERVKDEFDDPARFCGLV